MIFISFNQFNCFLIFIFLGIFFALIFNILNLLFLIKKQKIFLKIIFEGIIFSFFSIFFVIFLNFYNFGKFSLSLVLATVVGYIWHKKLFAKLFDFLQTKWYNIVIKNFKNKGKHNGKSKFKKS